MEVRLRDLRGAQGVQAKGKHEGEPAGVPGHDLWPHQAVVSIPRGPTEPFTLCFLITRVVVRKPHKLFFDTGLPSSSSVALGEDGHLLGLLTGHEASSRPAGLVEREAPQRRPSLVLHLLLLGIRPRPAAPCPLPLLHGGFELLVGRHVHDIVVPEARGVGKHAVLDVPQGLLHQRGEGLGLHGDAKSLALLAWPVPSCQDARFGLQVPRADLDPKGHALHLPVVELPAGALARGVVHHAPDAP
mmetsp:Transcript_3111/g.9352  ORF Transcript_3111/g.9352 Transcript_3111/m.9352 type:complete len:244 (+) Transcript_3111:677-1408(+)